MTSTAIRMPETAGAGSRLPFRLARAELLKLRRRYGLVAIAALLTVGVVAIAFTALELFHVSNSVKHGPAGGLENFRHVLLMLSQLGAVAAALVGATAGAGDLGAGVFRELVSTGRSRLALYGARVPGGLALVWPLVAVAYALLAVLDAALAGGLPEPSVRLLVESGLWVELVVTLAYFLGLGLGSLIGSRSTAIAVLFGWIMIVEPVLAHVSALGRARDALLNVGLDRIAPAAVVDRDLRLSMSDAVAIAVVLAWAAVSLGAGAWRTARRDA